MGSVISLVMARRRKLNLITEIQDDILDPSIRLSSTLRKAKVLAYRLKNADFKEWVDQELNGYTSSTDTLPDYRELGSQSYGTFVGIVKQLKNVPIPPLCLPEEFQEFAVTVFLSQGIRSLESLVESGDDTIRYPWPADLVAIAGDMVYDRMTCLSAWRMVSKSQIEQIIDIVRNRLLTFLLELEQIEPDLGEISPDEEPPIPNERIDQVFQTHIWGGYNVIGSGTAVSQGGKMTVFDQRYQKVNYQYNAAGDINFNSVESTMDVVVQLEKLEVELARAIHAGLFDEDTATNAQYRLKKAVQQAKKPEPSKKTILQHLNEAKALIQGVASAAGLVTALIKAAEMVQKFFP